MSSLSCGFCAHGNPEGSKFCNECGSPLHLVPCPQCEAINDVLERQCCRCGATLSAVATEEILAPVEPTTQGLQDAQGAFMQGGSVPIALAERSDARPSDLRAPPDDAPPVAPNDAAPVLPSEAAADPAPRVDVAPRPLFDRGVTYDGRRRKRGYGIFLGVAFLAVAAGVIYRTSLNPGDSHTSPGTAQPPTTQVAPTEPAATTATTPEPAPRAPIAPPPTASTVIESPAATTDAPTNADVTSSTAASSGASPSAPAAPEPQPSGAQREQPSPLPVPDEAAPKMPPARNQTAQSADSATPKTAARTTSGARQRAAAATRTKEQAERDAAATRRIIARQLGESPRTDAEAQRPPVP